MSKHSISRKATVRASASQAVTDRAAANVEWVSELVPGMGLYTSVRAGLLLKGMSFAAYCDERGVARQWVRKCLIGETNGPNARAIRKSFAEAAGIA